MNLTLLRSGQMAILLFFAFALFACKKEKPIVADTKTTELSVTLKASGWTGFSTQGMDLDRKRGILYLYELPTSGRGFYINAYNIATKSYTTVYEHLVQSWSNSNGSEGMRIRVVDDKLYVPSGFSGNQLMVLKGLGSSGLTLDQTISINLPYDLAWTNDSVFVLSGASDRGVISFPKSNPSQQGIKVFAPGQEVISHGSSAVIVPVRGTPHLVRSTGTRIELRTLNNVFVKSVPNSSGSAPLLQKDDKNRIYLMGQNKIIRFSADLETREEFPCQGVYSNHPTHVFVLRNEGNAVNIYFKTNDRLSVARIPN